MIDKDEKAAKIIDDLMQNFSKSEETVSDLVEKIAENDPEILIFIVNTMANFSAEIHRVLKGLRECYIEMLELVKQLPDNGDKNSTSGSH